MAVRGSFLLVPVGRSAELSRACWAVSEER